MSVQFLALYFKNMIKYAGMQGSSLRKGRLFITRATDLMT